MPQENGKTNYLGYAERLSDLCARLRTAGYQVDSSRLRAYQEIFARNALFIGQNRFAEVQERIPFTEFLNAFHESNEFLEACDQFSDLRTPGLRDRLQMALHGPQMLAGETGGARNYLFELVMAATLVAAGFPVRLDRIEDVYFEIRGVPCFMECKRVLSKRKLGERIRQAAAQIRGRCNNSQNSRARGIVAVDVSKLLNPGDQLFDCTTRDEFSLEAERKVELFRVMHKSTLEGVRERCVLGVYVYARLPGAVRQPAGLWNARKSLFIMLHEFGSESAALALEFFGPVEALLLSLG